MCLCSNVDSTEECMPHSKPPLCPFICAVHEPPGPIFAEMRLISYAYDCYMHRK